MRRKIIASLAYASFFLLSVERCAYNDISVDCSVSGLAVVVEDTRDATSCNAIDGQIEVSATGGLPPYNFSINSGEYQTGPIFTGLSAGTYEVRVKDFNNCWSSEEVTIAAVGSDLQASATSTKDSLCPDNNGTITVTPTGGQAPYEYQLDAQGFVAGNSFTGVSHAGHVIMVRDANQCQTTLSVQVPREPSGISYANTVEPIILTCTTDSGCHGSGTGSRDWTKFENVQSHAAVIKKRTSEHSMPPGDDLTQLEIDQIACWVDDGALDN